MITYGIILNNDQLSGDKYLNFLLFACIRWIASLLTPVVDAGLKSVFPFFPKISIILQILDAAVEKWLQQFLSLV